MSRLPNRRARIGLDPDQAAELVSARPLPAGHRRGSTAEPRSPPARGESPYYTLGEGEELVLHTPPRMSPIEYIREHPVGIRSYLWRHLFFSLGNPTREEWLRETGDQDHQSVEERIALALLDEWIARHDLPVVESRPFVRAASEATGAPFTDFFIQAGPGRNHFNACGNREVFAAIEAGLDRATRD